MTNEDRWNMYMNALDRYVEREGHARVPASHTEPGTNGPISLGAWVGYVRQRKRAGLLSDARITQLSAVPHWQWGPLRPGPVSDENRNREILTLRSQGVSLQRIGDQFGLSRQRVHQIVQAAGV